MDCAEIKSTLEDKIQNISETSINEMGSFFMSPAGRIYIQNDRQIEMIYKFLQASLMEPENKRLLFFEQNQTFDKISYFDEEIKRILYRIYADFIDDELIEMIKEILDNEISVYAFLIYSGCFDTDGDKIMVSFADLLYEIGEKVKSVLLLNAADKMYKNNKNVMISLSQKYIMFGMKDEAQALLERIKKSEEDKNESER